MTEPDINLRPARATEQGRIIQLILENNLNPVGLDWRNFIVAADDKDELVGCGQIRRHNTIEELASLVVVKSEQGKGLSTILMHALMERANRPLWLMCESPLVDYYQKFGFNEVSEPRKLPEYFRNIYWFTRLGLGFVFLVRGSYVAFMVLNAAD